MILRGMRIDRKEVIIVLLLFFVGLFPRILNLGTFLTADEKTWIGRSYEFVRAFHDLRFNDMLQTTHPGVTTLWAAGAAVVTKMATSHLSFDSDTLFHFIKSSQFSIAILNSLIIPWIYILLRLVMRTRGIAVVGTLLIALDSFIIGYSRVVHVDALLGGLLTLTILSTILYARSLRRGWLIASAVLASLALLTKIPAVFIFPFIPCALFVYRGKRMFSREFLVGRGRDAIIWLLIVGILIVVLWPALLWVQNPLGNVLVVKRDVAIAATIPHDMTEDYTLNPFHYPAALLSRSNPVSLIGGILAIVALVFAAAKKKISPELGLIALYMIGFVIMMTLGAKKGDRYIIPAFFALDMLAAYGIFFGLSFIKSQGTRIRSTIAVSGAVAIYLTSIAFQYHPYEVSYSNPLFPDNISQELGWGEGLDQVASWLNDQHPEATVASWYPGELQAFTTAKVLHINAHQQNQVQFVVLYRNMFGREPAHYANDFIDEYYKKREPAHIVRIAGKEFAWIYEKPSYPKTVGDMDNNLLVSQEVIVEHKDFIGFDILPATRFGKADTGAMVINVSRSLAGTPIFSRTVALKDLRDGVWEHVDLPPNTSIQPGDHLFIRVHVEGSADPYASVRYSSTLERSTPVYISRTGVVKDASAKPGSIAVQLRYVGTDGKVATELETRLLR